MPFLKTVPRVRIPLSPPYSLNCREIGALQRESLFHFAISAALALSCGGEPLPHVTVSTKKARRASFPSHPENASFLVMMHQSCAVVWPKNPMGSGFSAMGLQSLLWTCAKLRQIAFLPLG